MTERMEHNGRAGQTASTRTSDTVTLRMDAFGGLLLNDTWGSW